MEYFKNIDNEEKAYILGLVNKNNNFITCLCIDNDVSNILSNFCNDIKRLYMINIDDAETLSDIYNSTLNFKNLLSKKDPDPV